ncbi:hypothetical protein M2109_000478 [Paenibacillus sp. PastH-3]|nr:hypothetical protein [Paenibacillus sp. PastH-4]MDH6443127.1 hypothetical protein [Paenibacillus sp. PastF-4]MDH6526167.1 hypothetical protein [Paenibacillus sp. PastH-3]
MSDGIQKIKEGCLVVALSLVCHFLGSFSTTTNFSVENNYSSSVDFVKLLE